MTRTIGSCVLLVASFLSGLLSSAGAREGQDRQARRRPPRRVAAADNAGGKNDTRAALGLSYGEVLALHRELRGLVDIHKAPTAREEEIVTRLKRAYLPGMKPEVKLVDGGLAPGDVWSTQVTINRTMGHLSREGQAYLDSAVSLADLMMTAINDPETGVAIPADGVRAPVLVKYQPPTSRDYKATIARIRLRSPEETSRFEKDNLPVPHYANLSTSMALRGAVEVAGWILDHPDIHDKKAPQIDGLRYRTGDTYIEKARFWVFRAKDTFDHFEKHRPFDEKTGVWCKTVVDANSPTGLSQKALPTNRFMIFNSVYLAAGCALKRIDPKTHGAWYERSLYVARRGIKFWKEVSINGEHLKTEYPKENEYGPLYVWGYSLNSSTEDQAHLGMDLSAILRIAKHDPQALTEQDWRAIANALYSGCYDYDKHAVNKGMFRDTQPRGQAVFRVYAPPYGGIVGKHMPQDPYERFVKEHFLLWDERLEKGLLGRIDTYKMLFEIMDARRARYGK